MRPLNGKAVRLSWSKSDRLPLHAVVALGAVGDVFFGELLPVNVFVAIFTLHGRGLEVHVDQLGFKIGRLVAIDAGRRAVRPEQRELRLRMIEAREFLPRLGRVTGLASRGRAVGARQLHALFELALVRIRVATGAIQIFPVINDEWLRLKFGRFFVAIGARHSDVSTGQDE